MTKRCKCGRPSNAGWTGNGSAVTCCICLTAQVMHSFKDPVTEQVKQRDKKPRRKRARSLI
jgi:hypothetical protein